MILAGKKGKNTVQALVIFRNFMDEGRSNVNQTSNDIKNARGVRRERGNNAKDMWDKAKEETYVVCKKWGVRKHRMGEQVTQEWEGKVYGEAITKGIRLEMKQKGKIRNNGRDVLCIYVCRNWGCITDDGNGFG